MEHRWGRRLPVKLDVLLRCRGRPPIHGQLRNIGLEGMFIRLENDVLAEGVMVEAELLSNDASTAGACRVRAWVVHSSEAGAGLFFYSVDRDDYQRLQQFIQQRSTDSASKEVQ